MKQRDRSPARIRVPLIIVLVLLFMVSVGLFLHNLSTYRASDQGYQTAREKYEGVLTVEEKSLPENPGINDFFLLTDETNPGSAYDLQVQDYHQQSLGEATLESLAVLPHISRVEKRYLTAGVSPDYTRLDTDEYMYPYNARCVLIATVKNRYYSSLHQASMVREYSPEVESLEFVTLENIQLLAGDPDWLQGQEIQTVRLQTIKEEYRGVYQEVSFPDRVGKRSTMFSVDNHLFLSDVELLQPGHRYVFVLRNNCTEQVIAPKEEYQDIFPAEYVHLFEVGDDSLTDWWPYFTEVTDLPEGWLETDEFADLRELIRVTNDDVHTFDVVYGDDMTAQRRISEGRIVCQEGRFLTTADAGQPVCVVSAALLETYGLKVGDTLTLDLGNYLCEQYAPLGAVAVNRDRQSTAYVRQTFTIIGSWRDLNEGSNVFQDRYWCWSTNAIFVPSAFLPECRNAEGHSFKPGEVSFVVENAEEISAFVEDCLPQVEAMGLPYRFSDGGWFKLGDDLMQARKTALVRLVTYSVLAVLFLALIIMALFFKLDRVDSSQNEAHLRRGIQ